MLIDRNAYWKAKKKIREKVVNPSGVDPPTSARTVPSDGSRRLSLSPRKRIQKPIELTFKALQLRGQVNGWN